MLLFEKVVPIFIEDVLIHLGKGKEFVHDTSLDGREFRIPHSECKVSVQITYSHNELEVSCESYFDSNESSGDYNPISFTYAKGNKGIFVEFLKEHGVFESKELEKIFLSIIEQFEEDYERENFLTPS